MNNSKNFIINIQRYLFICLLTTLFLLGQTVSVAAAAGDLDRSFGNNGFTRTFYPVPGSDMTGSIIQPDGKFIVAGTLFQSGSNQDFYVLRFNSNGSIDTSFGNNGAAVIAVSPREDNAYGVSLQPDGKIIVVGRSRDASANYDFAVVRLNENGTPDTTFGSNGIVITSTSNTGDWASNAIVQSDNKIVVCGSGAVNGFSAFKVVRYNPDGSLDTTFNGDGIVSTPELFNANVVKLQTDGKIVVVGSAHVGFGFARYNTDGSLDSTFGGDGTVAVDVRIGAPQQNSADDFLIQPDGKIVAVGNSNSGFATGFDFALARLNSNGTVDTTFGNNGQIVTPIQGEEDDFANAVILQPDGKLLVGGQGNLGNDPDFTVIRYNPDGTLDTQFGNNGIAVTRIAGEGEIISNLKLEANGRLFVAGFRNFDAAFALYQLNGSREVDFDGDKKTDISIFRPTAGEWWYLRSSDGSNRAFGFGSETDKIIPADYTGDGKTDIAIFRPSSGEWFVLRSEDSSFYSFPFGALGDVPAPADFDGDGFADPSVFRPSTATWYIIRSSDNGTTITNFGATGDQPVAADYDGDGFADIAIFRPSDGSWWLNRSSAGLIVTNFGTSSDKTVPMDYTGDGKVDVAFYRPTTGEWFILRSEDFSFYSVPFGAVGDIAAPGDYDGDGAADYAVFRESNATWYVQQSTNGSAAVTFGAAGDQPVPNAFVR